MKKDRVKELKYLIYLRSQMIKELKKEIKEYSRELDTLQPKRRKYVRNNNCRFTN